VTLDEWDGSVQAEKRGRRERHYHWEGH